MAGSPSPNTPLEVSHKTISSKDDEAPPGPSSAVSSGANDAVGLGLDYEIDGGSPGFGDEASRLKTLQTEVRDQDDLERDIGRQADRLLIEQADERDRKRLDKTVNEKNKLLTQLRALHRRLNQPAGSAAVARIQADIEDVNSKIVGLDTDLEQIKERIEQRHEHDDDLEEDGGEGAATARLPNESQREYLIRTGKITPFSQFGVRSVLRSTSNLEDALLQAEEEQPEDDMVLDGQSAKPVSHRHLLRPGFAEEDGSDFSAADDGARRPRKRRRLRPEREARDKVENTLDDAGATPSPQSEDASDTLFEAEVDEYGNVQSQESSDEGGSTLEDGDSMPDTRPTKKAPRKRKTEEEVEDLRGVDDGNEQLYQRRLQSWVRRREAARKRAKSHTAHGNVPTGDDDTSTPPGGSTEDQEIAGEPEWYLPHPKVEDTEFDNNFRIPGDIYPFLFDYQKTGVQWLWELYSQHVGGIIGDEMGLGKTIQIIAFLAGLHFSKKLKKPIIVVCPATVMKQWVNEFHRWWPPFRVSILHTSGSGMIDVKRESREEDALLDQIFNPDAQKLTGSHKAARQVLKRVVEEGHVLVTTYSGLQTYARLLIPTEWEYAVLDEGHKIRNPNTAITIYCKELQTHNRVILSGTPMQNNLTELWSLFDFVFPMRLGTLVNFRNQFEFPIKTGGYANASNLQVQTAMKCAETLKDAISPYLLQRFKADVAADLPKKSEQVLFCKLTKLQRQSYEWFLGSDDMKSIMNGRRQVLYGIDILRKICNHPDLQEHRTLSVKAGYNYGSGVKSGKMQVVKALLELWKDTGHKALLFAQHRIMLDILEKFVRDMPGMRFRRMDGNTPIPLRQTMVDEFNTNPNVHVFLLTTKVGGLGVNLTGADRVIIYDPDWNPSTDLQARERAWRLGQKREVSIYRLMTAGTIEEKIYHRQIFKQFLTNKILKDPKQRQTFQMSDLHDLFTLGAENEGPTETSSLFKDAEIKYNKDSTVSSAATTNGRAPESNATPSTLPSQESSNQDANIQSIPGFSSLENYEDAEDPDAPAPPASESTATKSEERLMSTLFSKGGVHSTLSHDHIINGRRVVAADRAMIEREAKKVAAEAARELRRAGEAARNVPIGVPTWTGQVGVAGRPNETTPSRAFATASHSRRPGPSGSSILANLAASTGTPLSNPTTTVSSPQTHSSPSTRPSTPPANPKGKEFLPLIQTYLRAHGGKVHTQMLIDHFNRFCTSNARTAEFKECLKQAAVLEKPGVGRFGGSSGRGRWVLKEQFR